MPSSRHKSLTLEPASCCLSTFTICASVNLVFFIVFGFKISNSLGLPSAPKGLENSNFKWPNLRGAYNWEGDLIVGKDHKSALGTLVERSTRYLLLVHLEGKDAESVRKAFAKKLQSMPRDLKRSLTYDRGKEMAQHKQFTVSTKMQVYFCHPHSPWQRGTNENTNGLVRDFFPKGTDFTKVSKQEVSKIQRWINERPRETLNDKTPIEAIKELLSNINVALAS